MLTAGLLQLHMETQTKTFEVLKHLLHAGAVTRYQKTGRLVVKDGFVGQCCCCFQLLLNRLGEKLVNSTQFHTSSPHVFQLYIPHLNQLCLSYAGMCLFVHPNVQFSNHVQALRLAVVSPISEGCHLHEDATACWSHLHFIWVYNKSKFRHHFSALQTRLGLF